MEIIIPVNVRLKPILGSGPSRYPAWESDRLLKAGSFVYDPNDGHNYESTLFYVGQNRPSDAYRGWKDLGPSPGNVTGIVTNAPTSRYRQWTENTATSEPFAVGERCFFADSGREYQSVYNFADADPLDPYLSYTPNQSQYRQGRNDPKLWVDLGPVNALRAFDSRSSLRTQGPSPLTMTVQADGDCDRIAFFGLKDVDSISVSGDVSIPSVSLQTGANGLERSSVVLSHALVSDPEYELTFSGGTTSPYPLLAEPAVGSIVAGRALDCGPTQADISNALVTPRLNQNDRGNVSRAQQWYSKRITGIVRPPARTADLAMTVMARNVAEPLVLDFSRGQLAESGPLVYGFLEQANHTITGIPDADAIEVVMRGYSQ